MSDSPSTPAEEIKPEDATQQPPDGASSEEVLITLNAKTLKEDIDRLKRENPDFLKVYNTDVGITAARKYKPQIEERERRIEAERLQRRRLEILSMDEKEIEKKFSEDKAFAEEYTQVVHYKPDDNANEAKQIEQAFTEVIEEARELGIPEAFINQVTEKAAQGGYSDVSHWSSAIRLIQKDFDSEFHRMHGLKNAPPAVNDKLFKPGGDVNPASRGNSNVGYSFKNIREFKELPRSEQVAILDDPEGLKFVEELARKGQ